MTLAYLEVAANAGSAGFALLAAALWWRASVVELPGLTYQDPAENPFYIALRLSATRNKHAALAAGVAAFLQAVAIIAHLAGSN